VARDEDLQVVADQANKILESTVQVTAGEDSFEVDGSHLLGRLKLVEQNGYPTMSIEPEAISEQLEEQVPGATNNPTGVTFTIQNGVPVPVAGHDVQVCCGEDAATMIAGAFLSGSESVAVPTRTITAQEGLEWAQGLGVKQVVGEFTTNHKCCESRVQNIHRIADMTRGVLIAPGGTWSVNDHVGRRTVEKGFAIGGVIEDGEFKTDIGGGVSQYATTLFNAAFFGGYDIPAYKMHSKYISRYPYGREATLSYPGVDLKVHNDSPYGVVVWPTYTDTSITVQLWSTQYGRGEQTAQSQSSGCGTVRTTRTTTFPDKGPQEDTFRANYDCD
jgi:vancomycin resistance protein YoaR